MNPKETPTQRAERWLLPPFSPDIQQQVRDLLQHLQALEDAFYKDLEFGTGGMRGIMGVGTNRINKYTIGKNTQGLSAYLKKTYPNEPIRAVVAYDCRNNSQTLAKVVADVFSANGIKVFLFSGLRPTPELSFAVRHLKCHTGIVLTASHNPPEYNGYKVYWQDGGQLVPPHDQQVAEEIDKTPFEAVNFTSNPQLIEMIDKEIDDAFVKMSVSLGGIGASDRSRFSLVFTPLHGTAVTLLPQVLEEAGYKKVHVVEEQATPDGYFPTVKSPNPEEPEALQKALQKAEELGADMVIGTDPDADRFGVAVRDLHGKMTILSGNQSMILITKFLLERLKKQGALRGHEFVASTIVSTPMFASLAKAYNVDCKLVLTGFKWIADLIESHKDQTFIGGGEESFGYLVGNDVRDKDAITSSLAICEIANEAKQRHSSLFQELLQCYIDYGFYKEHLVSLTKKGKDGLALINQMMAGFRNFDLKTIDGSAVNWVEDYKTSKALNLKTKEEKRLTLPPSDVLVFNTDDGSRVAVRPSGTEPKIKFYLCVKDKLDSIFKYEETSARAQTKIDRIIQEMKLF